MDIDKEFVRALLEDYFARVEMIRAAGGIARVEMENGTPVPEGYILDVATDFFIPANLHLDQDHARAQ